MSKQNDMTIDRRGILKTSAAMLGGAFVGTPAEADSEPSVGVAVSVAVPGEALATKTHEVAAAPQVGIVPSSPPDTVQVAETFEVKVNEAPSSIDCDDGLTLTVGAEETVIVTFVVMVVSLLVSCACKARTCDPAASDVTV